MTVFYTENRKSLKKRMWRLSILLHFERTDTRTEYNPKQEQNDALIINPNNIK